MVLTSWIEIVTALAVVQITYSVVYRLFLSPIAKIPGPPLAALTSWYEFYYDVIKPGQFVWHIRDLHEQYGLCLMLPQSLSTV